MADDTIPLRIIQDSSFEDIVAQLQVNSTKILCIINGVRLHYYDKGDELPRDLIFDRKASRRSYTVYYFHDRDSNKYSVFGHHVATLLYPLFDAVDNIDRSQLPIRSKAIITPIIADNTVKARIPTEVTIMDHGQKVTFPIINLPVQLTHHDGI